MMASANQCHWLHVYTVKLEIFIYLLRFIWHLSFYCDINTACTLFLVLLLYYLDRWNRLNLIKKSNILQLAFDSFSPSVFILEIGKTSHGQAYQSMLHRLTRYLHFFPLEKSAPRLLVRLLFNLVCWKWLLLLGLKHHAHADLWR